jgi:hypothetical protein
MSTVPNDALEFKMETEELEMLNKVMFRFVRLKRMVIFGEKIGIPHMPLMHINPVTFDGNGEQEEDGAGEGIGAGIGFVEDGVRAVGVGGGVGFGVGVGVRQVFTLR